MKWTYPQSVMAVTLSILATQSFASTTPRTVYGASNAQHFYARHNGVYIIQLGSFSNKANAMQLQKSLRAKTKLPIVIQPQNGSYVVTTGPISSAAAVRAAGNSLNVATPINRTTPTRVASKPTWVRQSQSVSQAKPLARNVPVRRNVPVGVTATPKTQTTSYAAQGTSYYHPPVSPKHPVSKETTSYGGLAQFIPTKQNWYASVGVGGQFPTLNSTMTVNNGSGFPPPLDQDVYTTSNNSQVILGLSAGRRWQNDSDWLPALSAGVLYEHFFSNNAGGTITQYSTPGFTNYNYGWNVSSNVVLATAKLNLFQYAKWSPYINGGVGGAFNRTGGFNETALPGVTSRITPGFANNTSNQFAYNAGAGLDFQFAPQFLLSVGYLYQDLGNVSSGQGQQTWAGQTLNLGNYRSNDVMASVTYLFGQ